MHIESEFSISIYPEVARRQFRDPSVLARILPHCVGVDAEQTPWSVTFDARFMGFRERFDVELKIDEGAEAESLLVSFSTDTRLGRAEGEGAVRLEAAAAGGALLAIAGDVRVTGLLAAVGEGFLRRVALDLIQQTLEALERSGVQG